MMTEKKRCAVLAVLGLLLLPFAGRVAGQASVTAITYAAPDVTQTALFVNGQNFSAAASVSLAGQPLSGVVVDVLGRSLVANLPTGITAGSYLLQVSNSPTDTAAFVVILGPSGQSIAQPPLHNYFFGAAGNASMTGGSNTAVGASSLSSNTTGQNNIAAGVGALATNTAGSNNTAVGVAALYANDTGSSNTATGLLALSANTSGSYNTASGEYSLASNVDGEKNTGVGWIALLSNTSGSDNSAFGKGALLSNTTGWFNTSLGVDSLAANTTGSYNTSVGVDSLFFNVSGGRNFAGGANALVFNQTGSENTATGMSSMYSNTTGNGNTATGYAALFSNVSGHQITAFGYQAGGSVTGSNFSTFLGNQAGFNAAQKVDPYNSMALGHGAYTTKDNQVVIGNANIVETVLNGNVIAGTPSKPSQLQVNGTADATGYAVSGITGASCSGPPTAQFTVVRGIVTRC